MNEHDDEWNPDGGGSRVEHVIARAKERYDVTLTPGDIAAMEMALATQDVAARLGYKLIQVKSHRHQIWSAPYAGRELQVLFDPVHGTIRTVTLPTKDESFARFRLDDVARIKRTT